jgi:nucleotidyltransferase substrate binding protein (TIGR01987 family)
MTYQDKKLQDLETALQALKKGLKENPSELERDGAIQRFEFCFELSWKCIKIKAEEAGVTGLNSPKSAIKEAFKQGWINDEKLWLEILSDRNLASHTYRESIAVDLFEKLNKYYSAISDLLEKLKSQ